MKASGATYPPRFAPRTFTFVTQANVAPVKVLVMRGWTPSELPSASRMSSVV